MRFNRRRSRRSKTTNEASQEDPGSENAGPSQSESQERNNLTEEATNSSAELLEQAQNPNRLVSDWLENSLQEIPEDPNARYGQSVQEMSTHFAHKAIRDEESAENRRKSYPNGEKPENSEKTRKVSKILSLILGEGPSSSTLPTRESEVSDENPEQAREISEIKEKVDLTKVSADELRKLAEGVELLSKSGSKNAHSSQDEDVLSHEGDFAERSGSKHFSKTSIEAFLETQSAEEDFEKNITKNSNEKISSIQEDFGNNKPLPDSKNTAEPDLEEATTSSINKTTSKSRIRTSRTSEIQNQEQKPESIDYYSKEESTELQAADYRPSINNEAASSHSSLPDVVRSLENLEPLSPTAESAEDVSTQEIDDETARTSKISFQEIIAQTSTDDLVRVLSQVSRKTSRADIMQKLASATSLAASNSAKSESDRKSSISAAESLGKKSSSITAHDKTFIKGNSVSSQKSYKEMDRQSTSSRISKRSRSVSRARSATSSQRSATEEKSVNQNESAQNAEETQEKVSTKSGNSKTSFDRVLRKSSGSSVASEKKIIDNLADDLSKKSSQRISIANEEHENTSEEENEPKNLLSKILNEKIESENDEAEDKSFSETEEAKEREDLKEPSTSQRRITRGKLRSFISEKSMKSSRSESRSSNTAEKTIDENPLLSRKSSVKSAEDVIRSSNSIANSVLNDILKATKETPSEKNLPQENTEENLDKTAGSTSEDSLVENKRSEQFKVPPTPKPSRASMTDQPASPRLDKHRKSVPESAIDILRDIQKPDDLPSTPFNSKSSLNSNKQSLPDGSRASIINPETVESRRKTIPESAIDILREIQQPKDLPSTPANSLDSQNSLKRDSNVSETQPESLNPNRRKTIPESAIDVLRELQQSKDLPSTPHPSKTSMNSDKISDPDLLPEDRLTRKSILESAIEIIQNQKTTKSSSEFSNDQNLVSDTDGEGFSESEEAKQMDKDLEQGSERRITRGKLQSFIKSKEMLGKSVPNDTSIDKGLSSKSSVKSASSSRGMISSNSTGQKIIDDQAPNEHEQSSIEYRSNPPSTKSEDEKSLPRKSSLRSRKSSSRSRNSNPTVNNVSEDDPPVTQRRITRGKLSSFIKSKELLSSHSGDSKPENDDRDDLNSGSRESIRTQSSESIRLLKTNSKISKPSIVSENLTDRSVTKEIDAHEEIIANSLKLSETDNLSGNGDKSADYTKSASNISTRSRKSSKSVEKDDPVRTASSIAKSLVREITEIRPQETSSRISSVKSKRSSIKSQNSDLRSEIALDIYESFMSSTMREIAEEVAQEEGLAVNATSDTDISLKSSEYDSETSVKEAERRRSSKNSQKSDRSSSRSSARLRSQKSEERPLRTHSSIANSFVRHVLDDAQQNLQDEKAEKGLRKKSEISETLSHSSTVSEDKIEGSKLEEVNRVSSHSSGSQQLSNTIVNSENELIFKNTDSELDLNQPKATSSRISTRSRRSENSKKSSKSSLDGSKLSRVSTRSRSSSKKTASEKLSVDNLSNRPRTRSTSNSSSKASKSSSKASKPQSSSSKLSTRSSNRLKGKPTVSEIQNSIKSNSVASSLSLSGSKKLKSQTKFSKISKISNDESAPVTHKTTSRATLSSTSPLPQMEDFSDKESAISSIHCNSRIISETAKSSQLDHANSMNSKSNISDCLKSEEPLDFSDLPARINSSTTTSTKAASNVASSLLAPELITTETIWRAPSINNSASRSDSPSSSLLSEIDALTSVSQRNLVATAEKRQYSSGDSNGSSSSSNSDHQGDSTPKKKRSKIDKKESENDMRIGENVAPLDLNHNGDSSAWLGKIEISALREKTKNFLKDNYSTSEELLRDLDDPDSELNKILILREKKLLRDLKTIIPKKNASVKDSVHGTIELHPLANLLRNTPEFVRMKHISQLGTVDYVYPCAKGDRLIHSLGTYHLTERLLDKLKVNHPQMMQDAKIQEKDLLIVKLAAMLHDIGHGPWSHFWDHSMIPSNMRDLEIKNPKTGQIEKVHGMQHPYDPSIVITSWSHEDASKAIVRHIFEHNEEVKTKWAEEGMDSNDLEFLIELIDPTALKGLKDDAPWPMKGRPESHACLYEIVSNKRSGVDTDRMDYLKRDTLICKGNDFDVDYDRIFGKIKIQTCNKNGNRTLLTYEEGIGSDCMYILAHRDKNHREIYQHKKALAAEQQLAQALDLVKNIFSQKGSDNRWYTMAQSIFDMTAYCKFTEAYVRVNMASPDERIEAIQSSHPATGGLEERNETIRKLVKAKEIMEDLEQGRIWQCVGVAKFATKDDATNFYLDREKYVKKICEEVAKLEALRAFPQVQVQPGHFHVSKGPSYNMGKKDADPLEYLPIYEDGVNGYREGKGQSFYRQTMTIGSEYCISFFIETEAYLNEAKKIFTRLLEEEKIKHDHISEDFTMTPDARRNKRPCSPSFFPDSGATSASRRKLDL